MNFSDFEAIYNDTYDNTLKFIVVKCNDIDNINDIIQDTYIELYKKLKKRMIDTNDEKAYIIGIARNVIKRYYKKEKKNEISIDNDDINIEIDAEIDIEQDFITQSNVEKVWNYMREKDVVTTKIFYLYFVLGYKIEEISRDLQINESTVKSRIYRTLKEIKEKLGREV